MLILINLLKRNRIKFKQIAEEWLEIKKIKVKESTYCNYCYTMSRYIIPSFEKMSLRKLEKFNYNDFILELLEELSSKTVRDILNNVLKPVLKYANEAYDCKIKVSSIQSPKLIQEKIVILSNREKGKLESICRKENSLRSLGIIICLNTGLRIGEICALKWKNINLEKRTIFVKHTLQRVYNREEHTTKVIIDSPKTQKSIREIPISNKLYDILKELKAKNNEEKFFLTEDSKIFIEPRCYYKYFKEILRKSRIKSYKFHALRHTFATNCIEVGMDVKSLSEILGHASVEITLNKYVHSNYKIKKKYLEKL